MEEFKPNFPISRKAFWLLLAFSLLLFLMLLIGQFGSLISYSAAVQLGLQESTRVIGLFGAAMNRGFALADTMIYLPLLIVAVIGFIRKKMWSIPCMVGVMAITAYWPIACLATLFFAKGSPGFYFHNYIEYTAILGVIAGIAIWGLVYLAKSLVRR